MLKTLPICIRNTYRGRRMLVRRTKRAMCTESDVILERAGKKGVIILNRPKALNSLNLGMVRKIFQQLKAWDLDPSIKLVIIKGAGDRAFCAGGDVRELVQEHQKGNTKLAEDSYREAYQLVNLIGSLKTPYVALIDGITMGLGIGISVYGTYRVCTERTMCAMPETAIGFFPDVGSSYFFPRLPGKIGIFLALTGYRLQGYDVFKSGIATNFVNAANLKLLEVELKQLENPSLECIDRTILKFQHQCELDYEKDFTLKPAMRKINTIFEANSIEEIINALQRDGSVWSRKQLGILSKLCPVSLKVAFQQLERGANMTLQECLKMEYRITLKFMQDSNFHEGVRAVLIDKDYKPSWKPTSLTEVGKDRVDSYFQKLPADKEIIF